MLLSYFVHKTNIFSCHPVHRNQKGHHLFLMHGLDGTCGKHQERDIFFTSSASSITCISMSVVVLHSSGSLYVYLATLKTRIFELLLNLLKRIYIFG